MSRKSNFSSEQKIKACIDYLSGVKSAAFIARELNLGKNGRGTIRLWAKRNAGYTKTYNFIIFLVYLTRDESNCGVLFFYKILYNVNINTQGDESAWTNTTSI